MVDKPDNSIIEKIAINLLDKSLLICHKIRSNISSNDKTPSWDGSVEVYKSNHFSKSDLIGIVSIQVKGKWFETSNYPSTIKYVVSVEDLKNYINSNGVIFFVIYCNDHGGKVYYKSLMPVDINMLLKDDSVTFTKSVELTEFPSDDPEIIYAIFNDFIYHSKRQSQLDNIVMQHFSDFGLDRIHKKISFGFGALPTSSEEKRIRYMLDHETYIYAKPDDFNVDVPLGKISFESIGMKKTVPITVNGEVLYKEITKLYSSDGTISFKIGDNITLSDENKEISIVYSNKLSERINDLKFLLRLLKDNKDLDDNEYVLHYSNGEGMSYGELKKVFKFYLDLEKAIRIVGCNKDLLFTDDNITDLNKMKSLVNAFIYNKSVPYSLNGEPGLGTLEFGNLKLLILCIKDGKDFRFRNPFDMKDLVLKYEFVDGNNPQIVSPYCVALLKDRLIDVDNVNYMSIEESIKKFRDGSEFYDQELNKYILEVLCAYDVCQKPGLLNLANNLQEILDNVDTQNIVYKINRIQINKRIYNNLSKDEKTDLIRIKNNNKDNVVLLCCCILLESFNEAELYYETLSNDAKERFIDFPIKNLWIK